MLGQPPDTIPDDLTLSEYYHLGFWYEECERPSNARTCYKRVIEMAPADALAQLCRHALSTRVPMHDVSKKAAKLVAQAELMLQLNPTEAASLTSLALDESGDYESAHRVMALCHLASGDIEKSKASLQRALSINTNYGPAILAMARVAAVEMDYDAARQYIDNAREKMPDDAGLRTLERSIDFLVALDQDQ